MAAAPVLMTMGLVAWWLVMPVVPIGAIIVGISVAGVVLNGAAQVHRSGIQLSIWVALMWAASAGLGFGALAALGPVYEYAVGALIAFAVLCAAWSQQR